MKKIISATILCLLLKGVMGQAIIPNPTLQDELKLYGVKIAPLTVYPLDPTLTVKSSGISPTSTVKTSNLSNVVATPEQAKFAEFGTLFLIKDTKTIEGVKYYLITFLKFSGENNTKVQGWAEKNLSYVSYLNNGEQFLVKEIDFMTQCGPAYSKEIQASIGFATVPYVIRLGNTKGPRPRSADNDLSLNIVPALEIKWRVNRFQKETFFGVLFGVGVTSASISQSQFPSGSIQGQEFKTTKPISIISGNVGPFFGIKGGYFCVLLGIPFTPASLNEWNYYKAATISIGIGASLFKLSNDGISSSQTSQK